VITFEICSFVFSFLDCGNNSIRRYIWADLYAKLFLPPPIGRGYLSSNISKDITPKKKERREFLRGEVISLI
jgi:hypothetical protein